MCEGRPLLPSGEKMPEGQMRGISAYSECAASPPSALPGISPSRGEIAGSTLSLQPREPARKKNNLPP